MKPIFKSILAVLAIGLMIAFTLTFTSNDAVASTNDEATVSVYANLTPASSNTCCPPGWVLAAYGGPNHPAMAWDKNADGLVCTKGVFPTDHPSNGTPNGKGNIQDHNVKDNNNPCDEI